MAYLVLYGNGWTQRWRLADGEEERVRTEVLRIGQEGTSQLAVIDPHTDAHALLVVSWAAVAAGVVLEADADPQHDTDPGRYA